MAPPKEGDAASAERARAALSFELDHASNTQQGLAELASVLNGAPSASSFGFAPLSPSEAQVTDLRRLLDAELDAGRVVLAFEPFASSFTERDPLDIQLPPLDPAAAAPVEETFIAIRLNDQKKAPVAGRPFQIELPDGSIRRGFTNSDGFARVAGFRQDGTAKITFASFDEREFKTKSPTERVVIPVSDQPSKDPFAGLKEAGPGAAAAAAAPSPGAPTPAAAAAPEVGSFEILILDDVGGPIEGIEMLFEAATGVQTGTTNAAGSARIDNAIGPVKASIANVEQARQVMKPRFKAAREPKPFDDQNAVVRPLSERFDPIPLKANVPLPVLITPSIECHEIPGANFEFGRSYVRATAIEQLADIAQALRDTTDVRAMIFGHTDLSGSEALNKELSERRAKAIHALLTHDSKAWEQLFSGTADGANWQEKWDLEETQNMLNALSCTDDSGAPLTENGKRDAPTKQAIRRFQRGGFPDRPAEQRPLAENDFLGVDGRRALFLAYAKRISRQPIAPDRFAPIGDAPFMGCGEFNPLSLSARDEPSRRVNVFLFDPVAEPDDLPCRLRKLPPCRANVTPPLTELPADGKPPFRCKVFQKIAEKCTTAPGPDLNHDLVLRFPLQLTGANERGHKYKLEADDGTLTIERTLADDARANDDTLVELAFEHLPELHKYKMTCDDGELAPYIVFDFATLKELQDQFNSQLVAADLDLPSELLTDLTTDPDPIGDEDGSKIRDDGTSVDDPEENEDESEPNEVVTA